MERYGSTTLLAVLIWLGSLMAAAAPPTAATSAESVRQELAQMDQITWHQIALRKGLSDLSRNWNIPIFLDRRVDPDQLVDFEGSGQTRDDLLRSMAAKLQQKTCLIDTVFYIGPAAEADIVATIAEARFDEADGWRQAAARLRQRTGLQWEEASEPKAIIERFAAEQEIAIEGLELVPHDVWPAADWRSLPATHQLALLLAGFGLTYELSREATSVRIIPLPTTFALVREYQVSGNAKQRVQQLQKKHPQAQFVLNDKKLSVTGSAEDHYWIRRQLLGLPPIKPPRVADKRYQLTNARASFDAVARTIAKTLDLELQYDPQVEAIKSQRIEFSIQDATREQLLDALVKTTNVHYTIKGQVLLIHP